MKELREKFFEFWYNSASISVGPTLGGPEGPVTRPNYFRSASATNTYFNETDYFPD